MPLSFRPLFCAGLSLLGACASQAPQRPEPGAARVQGFDLRVPGAQESLRASLAPWLGQSPDAAQLASIEQQTLALYDWMEWTGLRVSVVPSLGPQGELTVVVTGQPPPAPGPLPVAEEVPVLKLTQSLDALPPLPPRQPAGSSLRVEAALDPSFSPWLQSRHRVLVDAQERRLYLKRGDGQVVSYAVAVGTSRTPTPQGEYTVEGIRQKPTWYPPASIRRDYAAKGKPLPAMVPPGRGNPLGEYFVRLQKGIGIHGTNQPRSIGRAASYGCIRMHDADVKQLVSELKTGDGIWVVRQRLQPLAAKEARHEVLWGMRAASGVQSTAR